MDPLQIIVVILVVALAAVAIGIGANRIRKTSESLADTVDSVILEYTDTLIQLAKDIIVISQVKRENCDTQDDYEQILMRMVSRRLVAILYEDINIDDRFKEIINEETLLDPLISLYRQYEDKILLTAKEEEEYIKLEQLLKDSAE